MCELPGLGSCGVAVDIAIHAPHWEGDQRNHYADVQTSTRKLEPEEFTTKTRLLDSVEADGAEIKQMRGLWAKLQHRARERAREVERLDGLLNKPHETLECVDGHDAMRDLVDEWEIYAKSTGR